MGKHKKIINNDPILKKDYKYEKRKKLRALEKQAEKQRLEKEQKAKQEIAQIQNQVQEELQRELLKNVSNIQKEKKISKLPKGLFAKQNANKDIDLKQVHANKQHLYLQVSLPENFSDSYANHFAQELPERIQMVREHHESKKQQIDRQVKEQIKGIFSIQAEKDRELIKNKMNDEDEQRKYTLKNNQIQEQQSYKNPYILVKSQAAREKQIVINNQQINYFTVQAYERKETLQRFEESGDVRKAIIKGYKDYVYIENKEENTIQQFRSIVVSHMIAHQNRCRAEKGNSKGFTNAKSVILCPFFGDAKSIIEIIQSYYPDYEKLNKEKLDEVQEENDFFRIGLSINDKKKAIKYFSHFNVSNIIIGSPVGLKAIIGAEGQSQRDFSFLSSVQILYIDRASVIHMQNWDHLIEVVKSMNMMPNSQSICNSIDTLRPTVPQLKGKIYRQSIVFSEFNFPQINGLKYMHFHNWQGCITTKIFYLPQPDMRKTEFDIQFYKMQLKEPKDDLQMRFEFFKRKFWDELHNSSSMNKIVIFTRSYFEFIRLKQFLIRVNASADYISQHTKKPKVQSKVAGFNVNKYRILLLTQRAYYYGICQIKKLQHLYLYSLPQNSFIYLELISQIYKQHPYIKNKVIGIYTKYDIMSLERIMGTKKAIEMVKEYCSSVSFVI